MAEEAVSAEPNRSSATFFARFQRNRRDLVPQRPILGFGILMRLRLGCHVSPSAVRPKLARRMLRSLESCGRAQHLAAFERYRASDRQETERADSRMNL